MSAEDATHPRLGHRTTSRRAAQNDEALRCSTSAGSLGAQISPDLTEERAVNGHDAFSAALSLNT